MKKILTLTDFSAVAEDAVATAFALAGSAGAELVIYHSIETGEIVLLELDEDPDLISNPDLAHRQAPHQTWVRLAKEHGVKATYAVGSGHLASTINGLAHILHVDLIVMGSTGRSQNDEKHWGSNAENIVKLLPTPVLTTKHRDSRPPYRQVVFASSFDDGEKAVLKKALALLPLSDDAVVHLLSIDTLSVFAQPSIMMTEVLHDFEHLCSPYRAEQHFYPDYSIDAGIRHFLADYEPDLIIMSNHQSKTIKHWLKGNSAIKTVNRGGTPILTMPS